MKEKKQEEQRMLLAVPKDAWETLEERLDLDVKSTVDKDLRREISKALGKVKDARETIIDVLKKEAKDLLDDPPGTNPEYERGMCELISRVMQSFGLVPYNTRATARKIAKEIGADWK